VIWLAALALAQAAPPTIRDMGPAPFSRTSDAEICATGHNVAASFMADAPVMVDTITRADGMSVMCGLKAVTWNKTVLVLSSSFRDGWRARKQAQFNEIICGNDLFREMQRRGWRFTQNMTFPDGERVIMDAETCPSIRRIR
jgi:hypothetical protein